MGLDPYERTLLVGSYNTKDHFMNMAINAASRVKHEEVEAERVKLLKASMEIFNHAIELEPPVSKKRKIFRKAGLKDELPDRDEVNFSAAKKCRFYYGKLEEALEMIPADKQDNLVRQKEVIGQFVSVQKKRAMTVQKGDEVEKSARDVEKVFGEAVRLSQKALEADNAVDAVAHIKGAAEVLVERAGGVNKPEPSVHRVAEQIRGNILAAMKAFKFEGEMFLEVRGELEEVYGVSKRTAKIEKKVDELEKGRNRDRGMER